METKGQFHNKIFIHILSDFWYGMKKGLNVYAFTIIWRGNDGCFKLFLSVHTSLLCMILIIKYVCAANDWWKLNISAEKRYISSIRIIQWYAYTTTYSSKMHYNHQWKFNGKLLSITYIKFMITRICNTHFTFCLRLSHDI